jgi:hypothetical protein
MKDNGISGTASFLREKSGEFKKAFVVIGNNMGGND